jgi:hypothetical protein
MARKNSQEKSRSYMQYQVERAALVLDSEADVYRSEEDAGLTAQQWQAVAMLVAGKKQVDVAEALGLTQETVSRWRNSPIFAAAVNAGIRESYTAVIGEVRDASTDAVKVLRECMQSEDEKLRLSAALATLRLRVQLDTTALTLPATPADVARESMQRRNMAMLNDAISGIG